MEDFLFPEVEVPLQEAKSRHAAVLAFACEAIDLAHLAYDRQRDFSAMLVPGIPKATRVRNDINDDAWRYFRAMAEPLVEGGQIRKFDQVDNGDVCVMGDGLYARIKKGDASGATSNFPTPKVKNMGWAATQNTLHPCSELDRYILDGHWIDVVYKAGHAMGEYTEIGLRFAMASVSPFVVLDLPAAATLRGISPAASDLAAELRARLTA
jgi:hypothetical protein